MNDKERIDTQRLFFGKRKPLSLKYRLQSLKRLQKTIRQYESDIEKALENDLHKSVYESYTTEIGFVLSELRRTIKHLKQWAAPRRTRTPLFLFGSTSRIEFQAYGNVLILAPWNYPFQSVFTPLIGAVAAGNCVTVKCSPYAIRTSEICRKIIDEAFDRRHVLWIDTDNKGTDRLLEMKWDYIFYTGGPVYGRKVAEAAARHLTPITLELGGKSPCIVHHDAHLASAARRIVWGKFMNCGQTCVAPDYLLVHRDIADELIDSLRQEIVRQYGKNPQENSDYPRIINEKRFYELILLTKQGHIEHGGIYDADDLYIAPTLISHITPDMRIMHEEIFGPILPILQYTTLDEAIDFINSREKPLALYYFGNKRKEMKKVLNQTSSGGSCINDVVSHVANPYLPFGGVGNSGIGHYHGRESFYTFSHTRSVLQNNTKWNPGIKFAPFAGKLSLIKRLLR